MKDTLGCEIQNTFLEVVCSLYFITENTRAVQVQPAYSHKLKLHQILASGEKGRCLQIQQRKQWKLDLEYLIEFYLFTQVMHKGSKSTGH